MEQAAESFGSAQKAEVCCEKVPLLPGLGCYNGFVHTDTQTHTPLQYMHHPGVNIHWLYSGLDAFLFPFR